MVTRIAGLFLLLLVCLLWLSAPSQAQSPPFVPGEILVKFRPEVALSAAEGALRQGGALQIREVSRYSGVLQVTVPPGREAEVVNTLSAQPGVEFTGLNYIVTKADAPNDPDFFQQWGLRNTGQFGGFPGSDIKAVEAWDLQIGSNQVIIAIVDTGVKLNHEDLAAKIWINGDEIAGNGLDDDNNGFIDDRNGWDFCNSPADNSAVRCLAPQDNFPDDEDGHGTQVIGAAAAAGNNGRGIAGVSWGATIMPVKSLDQFGRGTISAVADSIYYAVANGADVVNLSLEVANTSYPCSSFDIIRQAMQEALLKGVLVVAAAGNQNAATIACPAALDEAFAVGATTSFDSRWNGSNQGPQLDVVAPGDSIYTTSIVPGKYELSTGTSMAVPHVSGLVALLLSSNNLLPPADLRTIIEATADDRGSLGHDVDYGHGRINAFKALKALAELKTSPPRTTALVDDTPRLVPALRKIRLSSTSTTPITWRATITPTVSWLSFASPGAGTISSASTPLDLSLSFTRPLTYGVYHTTVVITGTNSSGQGLGTRTTEVYLNYIPMAEYHFLPLMVK